MGQRPKLFDRKDATNRRATTGGLVQNMFCDGLIENGVSDAAGPAANPDKETNR